MKKFLLAVLVGAMIAGAASVAAAEVTVGGSLEVRYDLWYNLSLNHYNELGDVGQTKETSTFWASRILLNIDAKVAEGLEGYIELDTENGEDWWGGNQAGLSTTTTLDSLNVSVTPGPGGGANGTETTRAYLNHHDSSLVVKQAWISFMVPGAPVGMKIGHQPLALGHGIFLDTHRMGTDAILVFAKPIPELLIAGVWIDSFEGVEQWIPGNLWSADNGRNVNFWAALANYTWMENNTAGVNFTYLHDSNPEALGLAHSMLVTATNTALVLDGAIAGVTYKGEVDYMHINSDGAFAGSGLGNDYTVNAWAAMLGAGYNVMDVANVGLEVAYGTGNSWNDGNILYNPSGLAATLDNNDHAYATPYNATSYNYAFLYNDKIGQGVMGTGGGLGLGDGTGGFGLANTGYAKLSVGVTPTDKLSAGLDFLYLRASNTPIPSQSRDLGWELDAKVGYKIYDNLKLDLVGGVFMPGAYYAFQGRTAPSVNEPQQLTDSTNILSPIKRDLAWGAETKLTMNF